MKVINSEILFLMNKNTCFSDSCVWGQSWFFPADTHMMPWSKRQVIPPKGPAGPWSDRVELANSRVGQAQLGGVGLLYIIPKWGLKLMDSLILHFFLLCLRGTCILKLATCFGFCQRTICASSILKVFLCRSIRKIYHHNILLVFFPIAGF